MIVYVHWQVDGVLNCLNNDALNFLYNAFAINPITFYLFGGGGGE
jgi:hypothetical protein